jgi:putative Ig domain-containing protein/glucodextranase-like protein
MSSLVPRRLWVVYSLVLVFALAGARSAGAETLTLMWDPSPDSSVVGYVVYVGTQSGVYTSSYDVGNATGFAYTNATAGQPYYFAVASYAPGPLLGAKSSEVSGITNMAPVLVNPGNQSSTVGSPVSLQLSGSDPAGQPVTYGVTALPPGLALSSVTGLISGTPTTAGSYLVTAVVSDGILSDAETFTWSVTQPAQPPAATNAGPVVTITIPTTAPTYNTNKTSVTLGGTATDDVSVVEVTWSSDRGLSGRASGTDSWIAGVPLSRGSNTITVQARDVAGNVSSQAIVVKVTGKK